MYVPLRTDLLVCVALRDDVLAGGAGAVLGLLSHVGRSGRASGKQKEDSCAR